MAPDIEELLARLRALQDEVEQQYAEAFRTGLERLSQPHEKPPRRDD